MSGALDLVLRSLPPARLRRTSLIKRPPGRLRPAFRRHWPADDSALIPAQAPGAKVRDLVCARRRDGSRETSHLCCCRGFTRPPAPRLATTPTNRPRRSLSSPGCMSSPIVGGPPPRRKGGQDRGADVPAVRAGPRPVRSRGEGSPPSPASGSRKVTSPAQRPACGRTGAHPRRVLRPRGGRACRPREGGPGTATTALSGRECARQGVWPSCVRRA